MSHYRIVTAKRQRIVMGADVTSAEKHGESTATSRTRDAEKRTQDPKDRSRKAEAAP